MGGFWLRLNNFGQMTYMSCALYGKPTSHDVKALSYWPVWLPSFGRLQIFFCAKYQFRTKICICR